jgi:hypothetical protein
MTTNTELQRLTRLRRLSRQIAASLPADLDFEQAFEVRGYAGHEDQKRTGAQSSSTRTGR